MQITIVTLVVVVTILATGFPIKVAMDIKRESYLSWKDEWDFFAIAVALAIVECAAVIAWLLEITGG